MKISTKYKAKPKKVEVYNRAIIFKYEPSFEEREGHIRRCIYQEQEANKNIPLSWIVVEKTMEQVIIKFMCKAKRVKK